MAAGISDFPVMNEDNNQGNMSPAFTREQAGQPDINAPTNPYANRQDVRRMILERMGGRDPFAHDYRGQAQARVDKDMQRLFQYAFRGTNVSWQDYLMRRLHPQHMQYWQTVLNEHQKDLEAQAADQQRRDMQLYTKLASEFETDRRQFNADYWKANPTEAQIRQVQMGVLKEAERMAGEQLKKLPKDVNGNPVKPGPDGKPVPMSPADVEAFMRRNMENNIEQIAKYTGTMKYMPREMRDAFAIKEQARKTTADIAKEWSDGKMSLKDVYNRINEIPDARYKATVVDMIKGSGEEGRKLFEGMRQHDIMVRQGKENESPFGTITPKNLNRLEEIIENQKPGVTKNIFKGIQGASEALLGLKKEPTGTQTPGESSDIFGGAGGETSGTFKAEGQPKKGFWKTIEDLFGAGGEALSAGFGPVSSADETTRNIAARGAGPEAMGLLESGWNLAKSMFTPNEAQAADWNPAVMMTRPGEPAPMPQPIGTAPPIQGDWRSQLQTMEGYFDPNPASASFVPAGNGGLPPGMTDAMLRQGPQAPPIPTNYYEPENSAPFYRDASDILFVGG